MRVSARSEISEALRVVSALWPPILLRDDCGSSGSLFRNIREQLQQHPHLTLQLIWNEYREQDATGYSYSQFCELYRRWRTAQDVVLRQDNKAGEKAFVDWAGATIPVHSAETASVVTSNPANGGHPKTGQ